MVGRQPSQVAPRRASSLALAPFIEASPPPAPAPSASEDKKKSDHVAGRPRKRYRPKPGEPPLFSPPLPRPPIRIQEPEPVPIPKSTPTPPTSPPMMYPSLNHSSPPIGTHQPGHPPYGPQALPGQHLPQLPAIPFHSPPPGYGFQPSLHPFPGPPLGPGMAPVPYHPGYRHQPGQPLHPLQHQPPPPILQQIPVDPADAIHEGWHSITTPVGIPLHPTTLTSKGPPPTLSSAPITPDESRRASRNLSPRKDETEMELQDDDEEEIGHEEKLKMILRGEWKGTLPKGGKEEEQDEHEAFVVKDTRPVKLSKFADKFTPAWLQTLGPATFCNGGGSRSNNSSPTPQIPFNYASAFLPSPLLINPIPDFTSTPSILALPPVLCALRSSNKCTHFPRPCPIIPPLSKDPADYQARWSKLLSLELGHMQEVAKDQVLYCVEVSPRSKPGTDEPDPASPDLFQISIPGIREDHPRLLLNDTLILRGLYPSVQQGDPCEVEAKVVGMVKRNGLVFVESKWLPEVLQRVEKNHKGKGEFNVKIRAGSEALCVMQNGVRRVAHFLTEGIEVKEGQLPPLAVRWLFPGGSELDLPPPVLIPKEKVHWYDPLLNEEQRQAVRTIAGGNEGSRPICISGPPGTGKTKTVVEAVLQTLLIQPAATILVCAPSNAAADTLARRLSVHLTPKTMFRLQSQVRSFPEVSDQLLPYCYIEDDKFAIPTWDVLLKFRVVVCSCLDARLISDARLSNVELMRLKGHYKPLSKNGTGEESAPALHWTHLLIDEAGQASEPETAVPISVVLPSVTSTASSGEPVLVLCGDVKQLPAIITSEQARFEELDVSLLERLTWQRRTQDGQARAGHSGTIDVHLLKNYRSHPGILMIPSTIFYEDTLEPAASVKRCEWPNLPNPDLPVMVVGVDGEEDWVQEGSSYFNVAEMQAVSSFVSSLLSDAAYKPHEIGIISPWREQVWRLRDHLRKRGLHGVNVGHVEAYQGAEYRCIILSCVRSNLRFLARDKKAGSGLIHEHKRLNVALTRAKELMIVIGNMSTHKIDPIWNGFLQMAERHGLYAGPALELETIDGCVSRLESQFYAQRNTNGLTQDTSDTDIHSSIIAGSMARFTIQDI